MSTEKKFYLFIALSLVVIIAVAFVRSTKSPASDAAPIVGPILGDDKAAVQVVYSFDFTCAHCQAASPLLLDAYKKYNDDVSIEFRPLPSTPGGQLAARSLLCATDDQQLLALYNYGLAQQGAVKIEDLQTIAVSLGADQQEFSACLDDTAVRQKLTKFLVAATKEGVTSVPVIVVNGLPVNWQNAATEIEGLVTSRQ